MSKTIKTTICIVAVLALLAAAGALMALNPLPVGYLGLDVNPSIQLGVNSRNRVTDVDALNSDASRVLYGMELKGVDLETAINAIIGSMLANGYLTGADNAILISAHGGSAVDLENLRAVAGEVITVALAESGSYAGVVESSYESDDAVKALAEKHQLSEARAALVREAAAAAPAMGEDELAGMSVKDLYKLAAHPTNETFIGAQKARELAVAEAGGGEATECELDYERGAWVYEVEVWFENFEYDVTLNAVSGEVVFSYRDADRDDVRATLPDGLISSADARQIAVAKVGGGTVARCTLDRDDGGWQYEVDVLLNGVEHEFEIDALTGAIVSYETDDDDGASVPAPAAAGDDRISADDAKKLALERVGGGEVRRCVLERDDGRWEYDIDVIFENREYELEINAVTGEIVSFDSDDDDDDRYDDDDDRPAPTAPTAPTASVSEADARAKALAKVGGGEVVRCRLETDDGRLEYDIEIHYNGYEYDVDVDATTGNITSFEKDDIDDDDDDDRPAATAPAAPSATPKPTASVSEADAKAKALAKVGGGEVVRCRLETDDGRLEYDIEIHYNGYEYDVDVDATTGNITSFDKDDMDDDDRYDDNDDDDDDRYDDNDDDDDDNDDD